MEETKIIKVVFGGRRYAVTNKRTRTDYGQQFEFVDINLPETFECIFSNSDTSAGTGKKMIGSSQRVLIPDEYLKTGQPIYAWILLHDGEGDGRHMYSIKSPVDDMPDTSPEEPTPVEQSVISQAITVLNSAVDTTTQKAQEATESADRAEQAAEGVEGYAERAEAAQSASESARDIALEAKVSAQASAATASEKASEAISSATTASQSAITAESASESAQEYASASAESASQASRSADTASGKASDAIEYASNANTSAQTASQKALEAAQSAQAAVQAKTDAENAKTASETAQGLAESARNEAVTAKTDAESARDEAQEIADGITGKVEQIDSNTNRIESLEDDRYKPYAVDSASGSIASFPDGADDIPLKSCIVQIEPVQAGSGDPSPDNVRPISGWTGCEVQRTGKNKLEKFVLSSQTVNGITFTPLDDGTVRVQGTATQTSVTVMVSLTLPAGTYTASSNATAGDAVTGVQINGINVAKTGKNVTFEHGGGNVSVRCRVSSGVTVNEVWSCQIELGSTATPYEPYTGQTYPITFPTEAGIVYGAYVDVTGGEVVVDRAIVDLGTLTWNYYTGTTNLPVFYAWIKGMIVSGTNSAVCSTLTCTNWQSLTARTDKTICPHPSIDNVYVADADCTDHDVSAFTASVTGVQYCYKLATPIHYPLTPTEIKTLLGQNNVWSNTGDVSVEYLANVTLYINKKIAEAISALS